MPSRFQKLWFIVVFLVLVAFDATVASCAETNQAAAGNRQGSIVWGGETNGYSGGLLIVFDDGRIRVAAYVQRMKATNMNWPKFEWFSPPYFGATNKFCGPIELQDASGKVVPSLKPEVSSPETYSETVNFSNWPGSGHRMPFVGDKEATDQLGFFDLKDYFQINESGEYRLTVWPKIYRRSDENKDLYKRIDIPPITTTIRVDRKSVGQWY